MLEEIEVGIVISDLNFEEKCECLCIECEECKC